jgi:hypothetical protein
MHLATGIYGDAPTPTPTPPFFQNLQVQESVTREHELCVC